MTEYEFEVETDTVAVNAPERVVVYGPPGIGKTTFAASAPKPVFIDLDVGSQRMAGIARNKKPITSWNNLLLAVRYFHDKPHSYETLVLDTVDRAQSLCHEHLIQTVGGKSGKTIKSISEVAGGYGAGYTAAAEEFRRLWAEFERIWRDRNMRIVVLAHAKLETVKNPSGFDYQRNTLNVHQLVASMLMEVSDVVMFASPKIMVQKEGLFDGKRARALSGDGRYLHTVETPSIIAKNRLGLPDKIPLSWDEFASHATKSEGLLEDTIREKARRLDLLGGKDVAKWAESKIVEQKGNRLELTQVLSKLSTKLDAVIEEEESKNQEQGS